MPTRSEYEHLTLGAAVRRLAEHHYAERTRHLSHDEYELLQRAADMVERTLPVAMAFG